MRLTFLALATVALASCCNVADQCSSIVSASPVETIASRASSQTFNALRHPRSVRHSARSRVPTPVEAQLASVRTLSAYEAWLARQRLEMPPPRNEHESATPFAKWRSTASLEEEKHQRASNTKAQNQLIDASALIGLEQPTKLIIKHSPQTAGAYEISMPIDLHRFIDGIRFDDKLKTHTEAGWRGLTHYRVALNILRLQERGASAGSVALAAERVATKVHGLVAHWDFVEVSTGLRFLIPADNDGVRIEDPNHEGSDSINWSHVQWTVNAKQARQMMRAQGQQAEFAVQLQWQRASPFYVRSDNRDAVAAFLERDQQEHIQRAQRNARKSGRQHEVMNTWKPVANVPIVQKPARVVMAA